MNNLDKEFEVEDLEEMYDYVDSEDMNLGDIQLELLKALVVVEELEIEEPKKEELSGSLAESVIVLDKALGTRTHVELEDVVEEVDGEEYRLENGAVEVRR